MCSNVSEYLFTEVNVVKVCVKGFLKENLRTLMKIRNQFNRVLNQENPEPRI